MLFEYESVRMTSKTQCYRVFKFSTLALQNMKRSDVNMSSQEIITSEDIAQQKATLSDEDIKLIHDTVTAKETRVKADTEHSYIKTHRVKLFYQHNAVSSALAEEQQKSKAKLLVTYMTYRASFSLLKKRCIEQEKQAISNSNFIMLAIYDLTSRMIQLSENRFYKTKAFRVSKQANVLSLEDEQIRRVIQVFKTE